MTDVTWGVRETRAPPPQLLATSWQLLAVLGSSAAHDDDDDDDDDSVVGRYMRKVMLTLAEHTGMELCASWLVPVRLSRCLWAHRVAFGAMEPTRA